MVTLSTFSHLLFWLQLLAVSHAEDQLTILTKQGSVLGLQVPVPGGQVSAFLGIPYADPPVGDLRFKQPIPRKPWSGVWEATRYSHSCHQPLDTSFPGFLGSEMWNPNTEMSEDCLYLNIWMPHPKPTRASVMVWIYGGGFSTGSASLPLYDGRFLSHTEGVLVVSMNYRLGPLGFLALPGSMDVLGNAGLFDQRLALQWVAENIESFGGDPGSVTLFGESAGAAAVGFHVLSPGSRGLFARAILQSGTLNAPWAAIPLEEAQDRSMALARLLGCLPEPGVDVESCLRSMQPTDLVNRQNDVVKLPLVGTTFPPTVDGVFLTDLPKVLLQFGQFSTSNLLLGVNRDEGAYFLPYGAPGFSIMHESLISREDFLVGVALALPGFSQISQEAVVLQYTDWEDEFSGCKNRDALNHVVGDHFFTCPLLDFVRTFAGFGNKAFVYYFGQRSSRNPWPQWMGVMHGYEIEFVFGLPLNLSLGYTEEEEAVSRKMMKLWANFAKTGSPTTSGSEWPPFEGVRQEYVSLDADPLKIERFLRAKQCKLWNSFLDKLQAITASVNEVEQQWKKEFQRWASFMRSWKIRFGDYTAQKQSFLQTA
ncbi:cholinesterase-like isoform X2 [Brienomyrus brachyistius]|uniref:cholinesterase-like isoform X2 n=1 Tax=Brienomyrus brachyistius TaxID=42636 RepID=UPI0020B41115|nr:cholinesterase-like isoform X2 [Brienomyrus brachyistius]